MKAILQFDLRDRDDEMAHLRCVKALNMAIVLWEITHNNDQIETKEALTQKINMLMFDHNVDLDELIE